MRQFFIILLAGSTTAGALLAQTPPLPASAVRGAPGSVPLPPAQARTPVDYFRELLATPSAVRAKEIAIRPASVRAFLEGQLKEFESLAPAAREARLQTLQLRWYMRPLMAVPAGQRNPQLASMPEADRKLVEERLEQWDRLPAELQKQVLENETAIRLLFRSEADGPPVPAPLTNLTAQQRAQMEQEQARWNGLTEDERQSVHAQFKLFFELNEKEKDKILRRMGQVERLQMQSALTTYGRLPANQRDLCLRNFPKFAAMSPEERQEFLANAERWQGMSLTDRQLWRDLVARLQPKPPLPPELGSPPPLPPGATPRPPRPTGTARATN